MLHVFVLRNYLFLAQHTVVLGDTIVGGISIGLVVRQNFSPWLLIARELKNFLSVIFWCNSFDLVRRPLPVILFLRGVQ